MRHSFLIFSCTISMLISCVEQSVPPELKDHGPELVHSISEYGVDYQSRAEAIAMDQMQHWPDESFVRWRTVRVHPDEILKHDFLKPGAMPTSLTLSPFEDTIFHVRQTRYVTFDHINQSLWEGEILGSEHSRVEIAIIGLDEGPAFVIKIGNPPNNYSISPTDSLDVYIAMEIAKITGNSFD